MSNNKILFKYQNKINEFSRSRSNSPNVSATISKYDKYKERNIRDVSDTI